MVGRAVDRSCRVHAPHATTLGTQSSIARIACACWRTAGWQGSATRHESGSPEPSGRTALPQRCMMHACMQAAASRHMSSCLRLAVHGAHGQAAACQAIGHAASAQLACCGSSACESGGRRIPHRHHSARLDDLRVREVAAADGALGGVVDLAAQVAVERLHLGGPRDLQVVDHDNQILARAERLEDGDEARRTCHFSKEGSSQ